MLSRGLLISHANNADISETVYCRHVNNAGLRIRDRSGEFWYWQITLGTSCIIIIIYLSSTPHG